VFYTVIILIYCGSYLLFIYIMFNIIIFYLFIFYIISNIIIFYLFILYIIYNIHMLVHVWVCLILQCQNSSDREEIKRYREMNLFVVYYVKLYYILFYI